MTDQPAPLPLLFQALRFAAVKHRDQRRKGADGSPYINHPIEVAELLATIGGITDSITLAGAILHDTVEDTATTLDELQSLFGAKIAALVAEVTDDKSLPKETRKLLQIEHAPHKSARAKLIKIADKTTNVRDLGRKPPVDWSVERRREYFEWAGKVVAGLRGVSPALEACFDAALAEARASIAGESDAVVDRLVGAIV